MNIPKFFLATVVAFPAAFGSWSIPIVGVAGLLASTPAYAGCSVNPVNQGLDCEPDIIPDVPSAPNYVAVAVSDSTLATGSSWHASSRAKAEQIALAYCRREARDCHVVSSGWSTCLALATSSDGAQGYDFGDYPETAEKKALARCNSVSSKPCSIKTHPCSDD